MVSIEIDRWNVTGQMTWFFGLEGQHHCAAPTIHCGPRYCVSYDAGLSPTVGSSWFCEVAAFCVHVMGCWQGTRDGQTDQQKLESSDSALKMFVCFSTRRPRDFREKMQVPPLKQSYVDDSRVPITGF